MVAILKMIMKTKLIKLIAKELPSEDGIGLLDVQFIL
jgi:hypothetical protein